MPQLISQTTFVVVDVETTGFAPPSGAITEIAMVKVRNGLIFDEFSTLVNPLQPIPYRISAMTGIDDAMVSGSPTERQVAPIVFEFVGDGVFTAHNARFDFGFVNNTLLKAKIPPLANSVLCTRKLARRLMPNVHSKALGPLTRSFGIHNWARHRARGDAYATVEILVRLLDKLEREFEVVDLEGLMNFQ